MTETAAPLEPPSPRKTRNRRVVLALIVLTLACYWPVGTFEFINYDDPRYIPENEVINKGLTWEGIKYSFTSFEVGYRHPLAWISHLIDVSLFGMNAGGHHVTSMVFHTINVVLLWWVLLRLTGAVWPAAWVAAIHAVHPTHLESVAWVTERKDTLSLMFLLLTIWAYAVYAEKPSIKRYLLVALGLIAALLSKPMMVTTPALLLLLDVWPLRRITLGAGFARSLLRPALEKIPLLALSAVATIVTILDTAAVKTLVTFDQYSLPFRIQTTLVGYMRYVGKLLWPTNLSIFYPYPEKWPIPQVVLSAIGLIVISTLVLWQARRRPYLLVGWLFFAIAISPVIGMIPGGEASLGDRYTYAPFIGLCIALAWLARDLARRYAQRQLVLGLGVVTVLACATLTAIGVWRWQNSLTIMGHALAVTDRNWTAHNNYADALMELGRTDGLEAHIRAAYRYHPTSILTRANLANYLIDNAPLEEARTVLEPLARDAPDDARVLTVVANFHAKAGRHEQALRFFDRALQQNPRQVEAMMGKAGSLLTLNRIDQAESLLRRALQVKPRLPLAEHRLGLIAIARNDPSAALEHFERALALQPTLELALLDYGILLAKLGRYDEALDQLNQALDHFKPKDYAHRALAEQTIGIILERLARPLDAAGHFIKAVESAQAGVSAQPADPTTHYQLAMTLRQTGQFDAAHAAAAKAMEVAVKTNNQATIRMLRAQFPGLPTTAPSTAPATQTVP